MKFRKRGTHIYLFYITSIHLTDSFSKTHFQYFFLLSVLIVLFTLFKRCLLLNGGQPFFNGNVKYDKVKHDQIVTVKDKSGLLIQRTHLDNALSIIRLRLPNFEFSQLRHDFIMYWSISGGPARQQRNVRRSEGRKRRNRRENEALESEELVTPKLKSNVHIHKAITKNFMKYSL